MSVSIAFTVNEACARELATMGFHKEEVWVKFNGDISTEKNRKRREAEFWGMKNMPFQFATTDFWGAA